MSVEAEVTLDEDFIAGVFDEYKARLIVRDLFLNLDFSYWKKRTPELKDLFKANAEDPEFLFPMVTLRDMAIAKDDKDFWQLIHWTMEDYGFLDKNTFTYNEAASVRCRLAVSLSNPQMGEPVSYASSMVDLLENYTISDLMVKFPDDYEIAKSNADGDMQEQRLKARSQESKRRKAETVRLFQLINEAFSLNGYGKKERDALNGLIDERIASVGMGFSHEGHRVGVVSMRKYCDVLVVESAKKDSAFVKMPIEWQWDMSTGLSESEIAEILENCPF